MNDSGFWTGFSILISLAIAGIWLCVETLMLGEFNFMEYIRWGDITIPFVIFIAVIAVMGFFILCYKLWFEEPWQERRFEKLSKQYKETINK